MNPHKMKNKGKSHPSGNREKVGSSRRKRRILTRELIEEFAQLVPQCFFLETVSACLNINRITWRGWLHRGRLEALRLAEDPEAIEAASEILYLRFFEMYREVLARAETNLLNIIAKASGRQWTAAAWLLERRFPEKWGSDKRDMAELKKQVKEMELQQVKDKERVTHGTNNTTPGSTNGYGADRHATYNN